MKPRTFGLIVLALMSLAAPLQSAEPADQPDDLSLWVSDGNWTNSPIAVLSTPEKQMELAEKMESVGDVRQAAEAFRRLAYAYPQAQRQVYGADFKQTEDLAEIGLVRAAKNYLSSGELAKSRDQLNEIRRRYSTPTYLNDMGAVEIALARSYLEGKGEGGTFQLASRIRKARRIFEDVLKSDPQGDWADDALLGLGQCNEVLGDYVGAIEKYKEMLEKYPRSELRAEAEGRIAVCINAGEPRPLYSESETIDARRRIKAALLQAENDPNTTLDVIALKENDRILMERQAEKRFERAIFYEKNGKFRAAERTLEFIQNEYSETSWAAKATESLIRIRRR